MRPVLILLSALALAGVVAHALAVVAPAVEAEIDTAAEAATARLTVHPAKVITRGRDIVLLATVDREEDRAALIDALVRIPGAGTVRPEITVLPWAEPYRITAERGAEGAVRLSGSVPTAAAERKVIDAARAISPGKAVTSALVLAAGAPKGDWTGLVASGLAALGHLREGRVEVEGLAGRIAGRVADAGALAAAEAALAAAGTGTWTAELNLILPVVSPYAFRAERRTDGVTRFRGVAPDAASQERFRRLSGEGAVGEVTLADGMPDPEWPGLVRRALLAFALLETGSVTVEDLAVTIEGEVADRAAAARLAELTGAGWAVSVTVLDRGPPPRLVVRVEPGGSVAAEGILPEGLAPATFRREVPELAGAGGIEGGGAASAEPWDPALEALALVLPKIETGRIEILDGAFRAEGRLAPGFSAQSARSAIRAVLGPAWETELDLADAPPAAGLVIAKDDGALRLSGILPEGVEVETALVRAGGADAAGITSGGAREERDWRVAIDATVRVLAAYETAEGRIGDGRIALDGRLAPGHRGAELAAVLAGSVGDGWEVALAGEETAVPNGTLRRSVTGPGEERLSAGYWLPVLGFPPDTRTCAEESGAPATGGGLEFAPGGTGLGSAGPAALDRLAAVMLRCIAEGGLAVTISGHTDSVGDPEANRALSEERALAVRDAMAARGVPAEALRVLGLGDTVPVASNDSEEGRARNRRIEFLWETPPEVAADITLSTGQTAQGEVPDAAGTLAPPPPEEEGAPEGETLPEPGALVVERPEPGEGSGAPAGAAPENASENATENAPENAPETLPETAAAPGATLEAPATSGTAADTGAADTSPGGPESAIFPVRRPVTAAPGAPQ